MSPSDFKPRGLFRNPHVQSILASSPVRRWKFRERHRLLEARSREWILDCGDGVRLQGFHAAQNLRPQARGLVVLLHGWEGSARSSYLLNVGARLLGEGYDVFRLNLRDHGDTHHLNEAVFHSCRIDEVVGAVAEIARLFPARPLAIAGFSLGGNFALRVALRAPERGIELARVVAVCPAIRPIHILDALERRRLYHDYFMRKWRDSLRRKQRLFPERYPLGPDIYKLDMRGLTQELILRETNFGTIEAYFDGYAIHEGRLAALRVPGAILMAADDPIIPVEDFTTLQLPAQVHLDLTEYGGHCGFISDWSLHSWAEDYLVAQLGDRDA
ncbi:MAG: alpha/beta fold hydrolase [Xanthomonadales bacterium]|nr:alpha/beta fold hydrolase [Xanthomonadales bacterium]MBP7622792.1 alpha/beta fold hydrolase [Xanthomonadales bacterium]